MWQFLSRRRHCSPRNLSRSGNRRRNQPRLELLEDRTAPATITLTGAARFQDNTIASLTYLGNNTYAAVNLRSAVVGADSMAGPDTILLETGTYSLQGDLWGPLLVNDASGTLAIRNNSGGISTIDAQGLSRAFINQALLTLNGIKVTNGYAVGQGGGIYNNGTLALVNSQIVNNEVDGWFNGSPARGGGIYNASNANIYIASSIFSGNLALGSANNLFGSGGDAQGGGLFFASGILQFSNTILNSTFMNNQAIGADGVNTGFGIAKGGNGLGGAIYYQASNHPLFVENSTFSGNRAVGGTGALADGGDALGGGMFLQTGGQANATLINDTVANNKAVAGAGDGDASADGNSSGGGLAASVIPNGSGVPYPTAKVLNTIIATNSASSGADAKGPFTSLGHNLVGNAAGVAASFNSTKGDFTGGNGSPVLDPGLAPLGYYGGPTPTQRLIAGSFAVDRGSNQVLNPSVGLTIDQRGYARRSGLLVDIGAVEQVQAAPVKQYSTPKNIALSVGIISGLASGWNNPLGATLTVQVATPPAAGTLSVKPDGSFLYTPPHNFAGKVSFTYRVFVNGAAVATYLANITVTAPFIRF